MGQDIPTNDTKTTSVHAKAATTSVAGVEQGQAQLQGITAFAEATIDGPVEELYSQRSINGLGGQWRPHGSFHTT